MASNLETESCKKLKVVGNISHDSDGMYVTHVWDLGHIATFAACNLEEEIYFLIFKSNNSTLCMLQLFNFYYYIVRDYFCPLCCRFRSHICLCTCIVYDF